ncbi:MAG: hypothetical protein RR716_01510 [Christensenellaceae bacterium]
MNNNNHERKFYKETLKGVLPDTEKIRRNIISCAKKQPSKNKWYIPVAICACAVITLCVAVPPVRAAITQWFAGQFGINNHLAASPEERAYIPEVDDIIKNTMTAPTDKVSVNSAKITSIVPEWQEWADNLNLQLGDILFDGKQLIITCDMGTVLSSFLFPDSEGSASRNDEYGVTLGNSGYIILNGEKYIANVLTVPTGDVTNPDEKAIYSIMANFECAENTYEGYQRYRNLPDTDEATQFHNSYVAIRKQFDADYEQLDFKVSPQKLDGMQHAVLNLPIMVIDSPEQVIKYESGTEHIPRQIGVLTLNFSFDPAAGYESVNTNELSNMVTFSGTGIYENHDTVDGKTDFSLQEIDYTGVTLALKEVTSSATGTNITVEINCPDGWDENTTTNFFRSLNLKFTADGNEFQHTTMGNVSESGNADYEYTFLLSMLESETKAVNEFCITPQLTHAVDLNEEKLEIGKHYVVDLNDFRVHDIEIQTIESGILKFSLK